MDRLADQTGAGMTLTRSIRELDATSVPGLEQEIRELQTDISWGGRTSYALVRLAERTKSVVVTRAVILMTNAMHASGDVAPVLRIAADEAQTDRRLRRRREQELFIYQIIIYVSMLVFIGIIVALDVVFIPSLPSAESLMGSVPSASGAPGVGGLLGGIGGAEVDRDAYALVLQHSAMIQGLLAGFVAGKMGEGSVRAGAKHAALLSGVAYGITFLL
jgi:flagellar protein FlaJ